MQRISIAEELSETIRGLGVLTERVCADGVVTRSELCDVRHGFRVTKRQARIVNIMQSTGLRLIRTGVPNKNLITDLRAMARGPNYEKGQGKAPAVGRAGAELGRQLDGNPVSILTQPED